MTVGGATLETVYRLTALLGSLGLLVSTLEKLAMRQEYADRGILPWRILEYGHPRARAGKVTGRAVGTLYSAGGTTGLLIVRLLACPLLILAPPFGALFTVAALVVAGSTLLLEYRQVHGGDGADQMATIVVVTLALTGNAFSSSTAQVLGVLFLAGQGLLSYFVSGAAKVVSPVWRSGAAVPAIVSTTSFGYSPVTRLLIEHPPLGRLVTRSVVLYEVGFPAVLVLPQPLVLLVLAVGVAFHIGNALVMGLNDFVWAFVATYPAVYVVAMEVPDLPLWP